MKRFIYLIFVLLIGCSETKTHFVVKLNSQKGYGIFMPGNFLVMPSVDSLSYRNVPEDIDEYVVRNVPFQTSQFYWNKYLDKSIKKEKFEYLAEYYKIDSTKLTNEPVDCEVLFLIGTRSDKRIIIIDSDNDEDFGDEEILEYEYPLSVEKQKTIHNTLPEISTRYEYYENDKIQSKEVKIKPNPYRGSLRLTMFSDNEIEKKYFLSVSFPGYKKGHLDFKGLDHDVFVSNGFTSIGYPLHRTLLFITSPSDSLPSEPDGDIPYNIGDVFNVKGHEYLIDSISKWGDELFIKYIGENTRQVGFEEGFYIPKFEATHLDNSVFDLKQYTGKYVLFDFWGTWCNPCIKLIPELKSINSEFSKDKFVLVSVAYDSDPQKVNDVIHREDMDWEHVFVSNKRRDKNSLIEKLKVSEYPTTILIDPDGKIIARNKSMDEIRKLLENAL